MAGSAAGLVTDTSNQRTVQQASRRKCSMVPDDRARIHFVPERFSAKRAAFFIAGVAQDFSNFSCIWIRLCNVSCAFIANQRIQIIIFMLRLSAPADRIVFHDSFPAGHNVKLILQGDPLEKQGLY